VSFASQPRVRRLGGAAILIVALVGAYAFSLRGNFLWDDDLHITANPTIVGPLGLKEIWTTARANYFPLVLTNFWLQHAAWGLDPLGYRVVTLAFHGLAALLLWRVLAQLRVPNAWLGAALWALHPVQTESVAWICELKNTQSAVFFLLSISFWLRFVGTQSCGALFGSETRAQQDCASTDYGARPAAISRHYLLAAACAVFAILSKPSTVMLPVALALCTWWVCGRIGRRDLLALVPFFVVSGFAAGWTVWEQKFHSGALGAEWSQSFPERLAIAGRVIWFYLGKLVWPEPLIFIYPRWQIDAHNPLAYTALAAALAVGIALWRGRRGALRPVAFAMAFFVALLFPVLGFFSVYFFRYSFVGDHFQYLASMGPLALIGAAIARVAPRRAFVAGGVLVVGLAILTARQTRIYLNNEALWRHTIARNPSAVMAWLNLADTLARAERHDEAIATFRHALTLRPDDPHALNDLGCELTLMDRPAEAVTQLERALALKPDYPEAHSNLGNALRALGRSDDAIAHYRRALELLPTYIAALNNLGAELAERGRLDEAAATFRRALALKPTDYAAHDNLATALRKLGKLDDALAQHAEALRLNPDSAEAQANFGRTLVAAQRVPEALPHFEQALRLKPAQTSLRGDYANALVAAGRIDDALVQLRRAVELSPNSAEAQLNLGTVLAQTGQLDEAMRSFEAALRISPDFAAARLNLGNALAASGRWPEAVRQFETAAKLQPDSALAHAQLAVALVNTERLEAAMPHFEAALRLRPTPELHEQFAQVLRALGRNREAFEHLERAADLRRAK
jgi:tetratricopeptide (TPR) repeat protein